MWSLAVPCGSLRYLRCHKCGPLQSVMVFSITPNEWRLSYLFNWVICFTGTDRQHATKETLVLLLHDRVSVIVKDRHYSVRKDKCYMHDSQANSQMQNVSDWILITFKLA